MDLFPGGRAMLSKLSVKKPYTVIVGIILVIVLGYISFQHMSTDLLPSMNLPYVVVYTTYPGATPEQVESEVTRPMEASFATLTDIKKLTSQSRDNVSVVIMQFNDGANMDTALIEISAQLDQLKGTWDDDVGAPVALKLNPDMLPVAILSVTRDDMDILALSDYVNDELVPAFEGLNGVAAANASGVIEQEVDVTIEQSRIDVVNSAILKEVDKELAKVERKLNEGQAQIADGKRQLANGKAMAYEKLKQAEDALKQGKNKIAPAVEQLTAQRDGLLQQRAQLVQAVEALESADSMTDEQKQAVLDGAAQLETLRQQKAALEKQLAALESGDFDTSELLRQRMAAQAQRELLAGQRDALKTFIDELKLLDADALAADITRLTTEIADAERELADAQSELDELNARRGELRSQVSALRDQISAAGGGSAEASGSDETEKSDAADDRADEKRDGDKAESEKSSPEKRADDASGDGDTSASEEGADAAPAEDAQPDAQPTEIADEATSEDIDAAEEAQAEDDAAPEVEPKDEGEVKSEPETKAETEEESKPEAGEETKTETSEESKSEPKNETKEETKSEPKSETKEETKSEPKSETKEETKSESKSETKEETKAEPKGETKEETKSEPKSETREEAKPEPKVEAQPAAEIQAEADDQAARLPFGRAMAEGESVAELQRQLDAAQAQLSEVEAQIAAKSLDILDKQGDIAAKELEKGARQLALDALENHNEDIAARVEEAEAQIATLDQSVAALDEQIAAMDAMIAGGQGDVSALAGQLSLLEQGIQALEASGVEQAAALLSDPKQLKAQYKEAQAGLKELDKGLETMNAMIDKLNQGIIPGGYIDGIDKDTKLSDAEDALKKARSQMESAFSQAESMLAKAEKELAKARSEFNEKREDAFKEAGLDGVITVQMVAGIIGAQNFSMPAGYVKDLDDDNVLVRVGDKFGTIDELKRMKLFNLDLDSIDEVRMLDVASVKLSDNRDEVFTKLDGQDGILLSLEKQSTYSTADVADTILAKAKELQAADPSLHIVDLMNQGEYIDLVVDSVLNNLLSGGGLAILILLIFLLDWRPTLTVAFSIPISVVIAFVAMYFSGITLNVLSLSGLALGIGMLVDNSIVSIENIYRLHDEENMPLLRSCVEGVKSVSGALFSSTLTTICVFLPIVFVQGMARDLFADMGLTIAYSLLASLLVAMTVVPMMCSFLMRKSKPRKHRIFSKIQAGYAGLLKGALRVKPLVLLVAVALLAVSGMQVTKMGVSFMPEVNSRQMSADLTPDSEMSDADQKAQATQIMTDMLEIPGIQSIGLMSGSGTMLSSGGGFSYYIIVDEDAGVKNVDIARQIDAIGEKYNADLTAQASTMDISMMTGSGITVEITGEDIETLQALAKDIADIARDTEGVTDVDDGMEDAVPELRIVVDKEKAIDQSLTTAQVYQFIAQKLMEKTEVGKVTLDGKEMKIQLIEGRNQGLKPEDIQDLEIEVEKEEEDVLVRIGDIAELRDTASLSTIHRASQRRMVSVSFGIADGYSANLVSDAFEAKLKEYKLPDGYRAELSGENETVMGIMEDLVWMILVAVLLIFLIMVAQFQSFKSPIIVMFTIPLAFTGGLLALLLTGMDLSIVAMLGFLVLSGVVVNNGIVFIDCVNQLRIAGWEKKEALVEAGRQRLRPILMTALTTILGMSTMALGHGTGAEMMQPMAVVSIGGLTYATLMTLFVVPVLYDLFNGKRMKAREIQMIREAAGMNGDEVLMGDAPAEPEKPAAPERPAEAEPVGEPEKPAAPVTVTEPAVEPEKSERPAAPVTMTEPVVEPERPIVPDVPEAPDAPPVPVFAARPEKSGKATPIRVRLNPVKKK